MVYKSYSTCVPVGVSLNEIRSRNPYAQLNKHTHSGRLFALSIYPDQLYCWSFATTFCKDFDWHKVNKFTSCPFFNREIQRSRAHITCAIFFFFLKWDYRCTFSSVFFYSWHFLPFFFHTHKTHFWVFRILKYILELTFFYCDFAVSVMIFATWSSSANKCQYFQSSILNIDFNNRRRQIY